ncbi:hypothetical protein [Clostridium thailandense]|uniref:hypothetical protein n=1 Tax=Clostridium thailandense TaxID=2794346 RepID=UPI003989B059
MYRGLGILTFAICWVLWIIWSIINVHEYGYLNIKWCILLISTEIIRTNDFYKPIEKLKNGTYKIKSGIVYLCFSSDFFIEEADAWRDECWNMIKERSDLKFLFLTKRIDRFKY